MFSPRGPPARSKVSPFISTGQTAKNSQTRRRSTLFTPQKTTRSQTQNRSLQTSHVLEDTAEHRVESYGVPLPVLVTEALTLADRHTELSVKIDPSGWAWLVGGRKLFIWRYKSLQHGRSAVCKELTLPPSDLAHNAARVCVIPSAHENQPAACLAVSPEGVIRYWPSIAHEASSVEISAELKGEECSCVINIQPYGCILGTTTSTLMLLTPILGQNTVTCHPLKAQTGMFAGFSRRMSSFIFGGGPGMSIDAQLQAVVAGKMEDEMCRPFFVLTGRHVQKWTIGDIGLEKLVYQLDVDRMLREALAQKIWELDAAHLPDLKTWLLDMQPTQDGVLILGCGTNPEVNNTLHFALVTIITDGPEPPTAPEHVTVPEHKEQYEEQLESQLLNYRLLLPDVRCSTSYVYNQKQVLIMSTTQSLPVDKVEFNLPGDQILGAGSSDNTSLFFSINHGIVSILSSTRPDISMMDHTANDTIDRTDTSLNATTSQMRDLSQSDDRSSRMKAAFLRSCSGDVAKAQKILDELFPPEDASIVGTASAELDKMVATLSRNLIDDYPAYDPRWAESIRPDSTSSTNSVIIQQQLRDKQRAHDLYVTFLKKMNIWERLTTVSVRDGQMPVRLLLCEHAEKLVAAMTLRELHSEYAVVIDAGIKNILKSRDDSYLSPGLMPQDIFYREVSRIHEMIEALVQYETSVLSADLPPQEVVDLISAVNTIIEGMFYDALQYRKNKVDSFESETNPGAVFRCLPWTSSVGKKGSRDFLMKQHKLTIDRALPEVTDIQTRGALFQQLLSMSDIILDGYSCQLVYTQHHHGDGDQYIKLKQKYEQDRARLIDPFMQYEQYERAGSLAEKYFDFGTLILICEVLDNKERLDRYSLQFSDQGFSDYLYQWYMREGKRGKLLSQPIGHQADLDRFLEGHDMQYLSWLNQIHNDHFSQAHQTLLDLARTEQGSLAKKKTLLSLSKLSALADEETDIDVTGINEELNLVLHQELLPLDVLETQGVDPDNMRVLSPEELIELYVSTENVGATEYDFKKSLDLLHYVDQDPNNIGALNLHIWCQSILRDSWTGATSDDPLVSNRATVFFKTVELVYSQGNDLKDYLPTIHDLLSADELGSLRHNRNFQYLLKAGYEQMHAIMQ